MAPAAVISMSKARSAGPSLGLLGDRRLTREDAPGPAQHAAQPQVYQQAMQRAQQVMSNMFLAQRR